MFTRCPAKSQPPKPAQDDTAVLLDFLERGSPLPTEEDGDTIKIWIGNHLHVFPKEMLADLDEEGTD